MAWPGKHPCRHDCADPAKFLTPVKNQDGCNACMAFAAVAAAEAAVAKVTGQLHDFSEQELYFCK